jgi:hypothetical protein
MTVLLVPLRQSASLFFIGSNRINLFWAHYSSLSPWMCCTLWSIVIPRIVFGAPLKKFSCLRLILALYNSIGPFKIFDKVMLRLLCICYKQNCYLMNWLLLAGLSLLKTSISMCFVIRGEFKDLVGNLMTKAELLSYANLHSHLLTHKFYTKPPFNPWIQAHLCCLSHHYCQCLLLTLPYLNIAPILVITGVILVATVVPPAIATTTKIGLTGFHSSTLADWRQSNYQQNRHSSGSGQWSSYRFFKQNVKCQLCIACC